MSFKAVNFLYLKHKNMYICFKADEKFFFQFFHKAMGKGQNLNMI